MRYYHRVSRPQRQMLYSVSDEALHGAMEPEGEYYLINTYRRGAVQEASGGGTILYLDVLNPFTPDTVDDWVNIL